MRGTDNYSANRIGIGRQTRVNAVMVPASASYETPASIAASIANRPHHTGLKRTIVNATTKHEKSPMICEAVRNRFAPLRRRSRSESCGGTLNERFMASGAARYRARYIAAPSGIFKSYSQLASNSSDDSHIGPPSSKENRRLLPRPSETITCSVPSSCVTLTITFLSSFHTRLSYKASSASYGPLFCYQQHTGNRREFLRESAGVSKHSR